MSKSCIAYLIVMTVCIAVLASNLFVMPTVMQVAGTEFTQPKTLNALLLMGVLISMVLYGLARQGKVK